MHVPENASLWAVFTTTSFTPILEFDFAGPDAAEVAVGINRKKASSMSQGESKYNSALQYSASYDTCF